LGKITWIDQEAHHTQIIKVKIKDLPPDTNLGSIKVKLPDDVEVLDDRTPKECYISGMHATGTGIFVSEFGPDHKGEKSIYPVYPENRIDILEWDVIEE
jgi:hypothetical protein